jgi:hypothetical protein
MYKKLLLVIVILFTFLSCKKTDPEPGQDNTNTNTNNNNNNNEPVIVYIYSATSTPTLSESITLKNNSGTTVDISTWTLGDLNNPVAYNMPASTILNDGDFKTFSHTTLGFQINDSGETLYLKDGAGVLVDSWGN